MSEHKQAKLILSKTTEKRMQGFKRNHMLIKHI